MAKGTPYQRMMAKTVWRGSCLIFTGFAQRYGVVRVGDRTVKAHQIAAAHHFGPANGRHVLHSCDVPICVNPAHLRYGDHADNMRDMSIRGRCGRLTATEIEAIRADSRLQRLIAVDYGINPSQVSRIKNRRRWQYV